MYMHPFHYKRYGCGSCGPRGFYGSVMPHIEIENAIASFMGTEAAISYSDSASCESSTVPAFAKKGDLIVADDAIHHAIKTGVELSRSRVTLIYTYYPIIYVGVYVGLLHVNMKKKKKKKKKK
jgi:serine palmitoyltransferase